MVSYLDFNWSPCALVLKDDPREQVRFESFPLETGITEGYNADYTKTVGRAAEPFGRIWQGGDWNPINLELEFRAGISFFDRTIPTVGLVIGKMLNKVNWLKAAAFPRTRVRPARSAKNELGKPKTFGKTDLASYGGQTADPPMVLFVWGLFMTLQGRITAWTVTWKPPFDPITGKPHGASVNLTYQPESSFYPNWYDIRDGSIPNTLVAQLL